MNTKLLFHDWVNTYRGERAPWRVPEQYRETFMVPTKAPPDRRSRRRGLRVDLKAAEEAEESEITVKKKAGKR
jgi:hypothetical protein